MPLQFRFEQGWAGQRKTFAFIAESPDDFAAAAREALWLFGAAPNGVVRLCAPRLVRTPEGASLFTWAALEGGTLPAVKWLAEERLVAHACRYWAQALALLRTQRRGEDGG